MATKRSEKKCIDSGRFEDIYPVCVTRNCVYTKYCEDMFGMLCTLMKCPKCGSAMAGGS
jgi:hypothetical protein